MPRHVAYLQSPTASNARGLGRFVPQSVLTPLACNSWDDIKCNIVLPIKLIKLDGSVAAAPGSSQGGGVVRDDLHLLLSESLLSGMVVTINRHSGPPTFSKETTHDY